MQKPTDCFVYSEYFTSLDMLRAHIYVIHPN